MRAEQGWLAAHEVRRAGLLAANGRGWAIVDLALLEAGCVNIPLPHHFGAAQIAHALAGVDAVLTDTPERILDLGLGFTIRSHSPRTALALLGRSMDPDLVHLPPGTVKVTYTSGSTAEPKGVCLTRAALDAVAGSVAAVARPLGITRHTSLLPLATLLENVAGLYAAWRAGAACHLPAAAPAAIATHALDPALLVREVSRAQPESLILVPELLRILVAATQSGWRPPAGARFYAVGGARVSPDLLAHAGDAGLPIFEGYGLSECASVVCLNTPGGARRGSVGRPLPHARVRIDASGEIHVAGALMAGYCGGPAPGAAAAIRPELATGDLGDSDAEGYVYVRGRIKNLFITSYGRNLSPEWIESELTREGAIALALVCGEAQPRCVALVVPTRPGVPRALVAAAIERANARLPAYARVTRFAVLDERPSVANGLLTGNGRLRRERLLERHAALIDALHTGESPCLSSTA